MCKLTHYLCACPHGNFTYFATCSFAQTGLDESLDFDELSPVPVYKHEQEVMPSSICFNRRLRRDPQNVFAECWRSGRLTHEVGTAHNCPECWTHTKLMKGVTGDCKKTLRCQNCESLNWNGFFFFHLDWTVIWPDMAGSLVGVLWPGDERLDDPQKHMVRNGGPWWCELNDDFAIKWDRKAIQDFWEGQGINAVSTPKNRTVLERNPATQPTKIMGNIEGARRGQPPPMLDFPCKDRGQMDALAVLEAQIELEAAEAKREEEAEAEAAEAKRKAMEDYLGSSGRFRPSSWAEITWPSSVSNSDKNSNQDASGDEVSDDEVSDGGAQDASGEDDEENVYEDAHSPIDAHSPMDADTPEVFQEVDEERALRDAINAAVANACGFDDEHADEMDLDDDFGF